jgi:predicted DNA-binding transcriptional regulator AlpA
MAIQQKRAMSSPYAAHYIDMSDAYLRKARMNRDPDAPPYVKIGKKAIRYLQEDLDQWLLSRRVSHDRAA